MANIKIVVDGPLMDGHRVTFKAPCDCVEIEQLNVCHVQNGSQTNSLFTMKDSMGNVLSGIGNLFKSGAYVTAVLDTTNNFAYLQNSCNNGFIANLRLNPIRGYDAINAIDISNNNSASNLFTVPSDGVINVTVGGSTTDLNHVSVYARTYDSDGNAVATTMIGAVGNHNVGANMGSGAGTYTVYKGQKVFYTKVGSVGGITFYPFLYY